jgi:hypothetical protein
MIGPHLLLDLELFRSYDRPLDIIQSELKLTQYMSTS